MPRAFVGTPLTASFAIVFGVLSSCSSGGADESVPPDAPPSCDGNVAKETFWPTLCAVAAACDWASAGSCHPELGCSEAECNEDHGASSPPSTTLSYLSAFESCIDEAASCLSCDALRDCYIGSALVQGGCEHLARCAAYESVAACQAAYALDPNQEPTFDQAIPLYCLAAQAPEAPCSEVLSCVGG